MKYSVNIEWQYSDYDEIHLFQTLKEANDFLVSKDFIYDSSDEKCDYWFFNQFTFATVNKRGQ